MKTPSIRRKAAIAVTVTVLLLLCAVSAPLLMELQTISKTKDQYLLESAVANQALGRSVNKPSAEEVFNPGFMRHYNLSLDDYLDAKGYFAPNGNHWSKWSTETKTAAILMWWREHQAPSVWDLRRVIHRVNQYYALNDLNTRLVEVVNAAAAQQ